ncbi:transposase [Actinomadura madurae]|uniref:transposase n=1 Tax=Actinomadura madurae TaxID=1993 RepID=UPI00355892CE
MVQSDDRQLARPRAQGRPKSGQSPVDRGRPGSKHHVLTDGHGTPLVLSLTGGNHNAITQLMLLLEAAPVRGRRGRPHRRPERLLADRVYDHDKYRRLVWSKGVKPIIARRGSPHGSGWPSTATPSSAPSACRTGPAACASAGRSATTSTKPSSSWPPPSSKNGRRVESLWHIWSVEAWSKTVHARPAVVDGLAESGPPPRRHRAGCRSWFEPPARCIPRHHQSLLATPRPLILLRPLRPESDRARCRR